MTKVKMKKKLKGQKSGKFKLHNKRYATGLIGRDVVYKVLAGELAANFEQQQLDNPNLPMRQELRGWLTTNLGMNVRMPLLNRALGYTKEARARLPQGGQSSASLDSIAADQVTELLEAAEVVQSLELPTPVSIHEMTRLEVDGTLLSVSYANARLVRALAALMPRLSK